MTSKIRNSLIIFSFLLLSITIIGIFWLVTTPGAQVGLIFAYAAGLSPPASLRKVVRLN